MSDLPSGWKMIPLLDITNLHDNKRVPLNQTERSNRLGKYPYYGANGQVDSIDGYLFDGDYILLAEDGGYFDDPYRNVAYEVSGKFWVNNHAHILSPRDGILRRFLTHVLNQINWMQYVGGSTRLKLTQDGLRKVRIPMPPLEEQRRIVARLDSMLARTRRAREELTRIPSLVEHYKQAVLAAAFRGDLTADWRSTNISSDSDSVNKTIQEERFKIFFSKNINFSQYKIPEQIPADSPFDLPENWHWVRAEAICDFITKGTTPHASKMTSKSGEIPYIKVYNLTFTTSLDFTKEPTFISKKTHEEELRRSKVFPGDVLLNIVGPPLGKVSIVPETWSEWNINQAIALFRPIPSLNNKFLAYWFLSGKILDWAISQSKATAGQSNLTLEICRNMPLPYCSITEQEEIVRRIETAFARIDRLAAEIERATALLDHQEQAILTKAFRGELVEQVEQMEMEDRPNEPDDGLTSFSRFQQEAENNSNTVLQQLQLTFD